MSVMVLGAGGQLGSSLVNLLDDCIPIYHSKTRDKDGIDVTDFLELESLILKKRPDVVINAVAMTNVDHCETDRDLAYKVNSLAVKHMVRASRVVGSQYLQISTDYIFDGESGNYSEKHIPCPVNYYGLTKLLGETFALSYDSSLVVRTSGVFGLKNNFPRFALSKIRSGEAIDVVNARYSPIHSNILARALLKLIEIKKTGIINVSGEPVTRMELIHRIAQEFNLELPAVRQVSENEMNWTAKRPADSSLDITLAKRYLDFDFYSTKNSLKELSQ